MSQELRDFSRFISDRALPSSCTQNPHSFAARAERLQPSAELSALRGVLFHVLDAALSGPNGSLGELGPLSQAWRESPGLTFSQALESLSGAQRQSLIQTLGSSGLAQISSLSQESDAEMLGDQLLHLAYRWEDEDHQGQAVALYQGLNALASNPQLRERAAARLATLRGTGSDGDQAEFFLRNLTHELTRPEMLGPMVLAGTAFRLTRLSALEGLLARPAGIWTRGLGLQALSGSLALLSETTVFTLSGKGLAELIRGPQDWGLSSLGRDFASTALTLGALRLTGWASQKLFDGVLGIGPRGLPAGSDLLTRFSRHLIPQASMLSGLVLAQSLESAVGLREPQSPGQRFRSSLMLWAQFNLAGVMSRNLMGPEFARWEQDLDLRAETLQSMVSPRPPRFSPSRWLQNWTQGLGGRELATDSGLRFPVFSESDGKVQDLNLHMSSQNEGNGGKPKSNREPTLPFISLRTTGGSDPLRVDSMLQLMRRMNEPELKFKERLAAKDVDFTLTIPFSENLSSHLGPFVSYLEVIARRMDLPNGRRVRIISEASSETVELVKGEKGFTVNLPPRLAEREGAPQDSVPPEAGRSEPPKAEPISTPPDSPGKRTVSAAESSPPRSNPGEAAIPSIVNQLERLSLLLRTTLLSRTRQAGPRVLILEGVSTTETELNQVLQSAGGSKNEESDIQFRLLVPQMRKTFLSQRSAEGHFWKEGSPLSWQNIESQTFFNNEVQVRSAEEAYQAAVMLSQGRVRDAAPDIMMRWTGPVPDRTDLSHFLHQAFDYYRVPAKSLRLFLPDETEPRLFNGKEGRWSRVELEARIPEASSPPTSPPAKDFVPVRGEETASAKISERSPPTSQSPKRILTPSSQVPLLHNMGLSNLLSTLRNSFQNLPDGEQPRPIILERSQLFDTESVAALNGVRLNQLTKGLARELDPNWEFHLLIPEAQRTFLGRRKGEVMSWNSERTLSWKIAGMKVRHDPIEVEDLAELYPLMRAFTESTLKPSPMGRNLKLLSPLPGGSTPDLLNYVVRCLNNLRVQERLFHLSTSNPDQNFYFLSEMGHWRADEAPAELPTLPPEAGTGDKPRATPSPPSPSPNPGSVHFAEVLRIFGSDKPSSDRPGGEETGAKLAGEPEVSKDK